MIDVLELQIDTICYDLRQKREGASYMKIKHIIAVFTVLAILFSASAVSAATQTTFDFTVLGSIGEYGGYVKVPIYVVSSTGTHAVGCDILFDPEMLTYVGFENTYGIRDRDLSDPYIDERKPDTIELNFGCEQENPINGIIVTLIFKCPEDIPDGASVTTEITPAFHKNVCVDIEGNKVPIENQTFNSGTVTIRGYKHTASSFNLAVEGEAKAGGELKAQITNFSDPWNFEPVYSYKWIIDGETVSTACKYIPGIQDIGKRVTLEVTSTVAAYSEPATTVSVLSDEIDYNYSCGDNLTWSFDNGTLTISGVGDMYDYSADNPVNWYPLIDKIDRVVIGAGVTGLGKNAFENCSALRTVDYNAISFNEAGDSNTVFVNCNNILEVNIGEGVQSVPENLFRGANSIVSVSFPGTLKNIGAHAFELCRGITSIDLSGTDLTSIGESAFSGCTALGSVYLPDTLSKIDDKAFYQCFALDMITVPQSVTECGSNILPLKTVIKGYGSSAAKAYADSSGNRFIPLDNTIIDGLTANRVENKIVIGADFGRDINGALVHIGVFSSGGSLLDYSVLPIEKATENIYIIFSNLADASYVKMYVWDSHRNMHPVSIAERAEIIDK